MGRWHARACRRVAVEIAAVVDPDEAAATDLASRYGRAIVAPAIGQLPQLDIDLAHVCSPAETHEAETIAALERGWAVLVEKPAAPNSRICERLIRFASDRGRWIEPVHQTVFQRGIACVQRWLRSSGVPRLIDFRACSAGAEREWEGADRIAADILPHPLSLLDALMPGSLDRFDPQCHRPSAGEWIVSGMVGPTAVRLLISMHGRPPRHDITLVTDSGTITADLFHGFAWRESGRASRVAKISRPFTSSAVVALKAGANLVRRAIDREPAYPGLNALVARCYRAVADPALRPLGDRHLLAVTRARDRILRAADA